VNGSNDRRSSLTPSQERRREQGNVSQSFGGAEYLFLFRFLKLFALPDLNPSSFCKVEGFAALGSETFSPFMWAENLDPQL
jgi:hypothetical protein